MALKLEVSRETAEIIKVKNLVEVYSDGTKAVDGISFSVKEGDIFGFLGPNGAGKTTTIKILATLLRKTSGSALVAGYDVDNEAKEIRKIIGVQSQETVVDADTAGRGNLMFQGHLQRMRGEVLEKRVDELLGLMELSEVADKKARQYSGGMKRRLALASALVHKPKLIFLDEPTTGLDPQSRARLWEYLEHLNKDEGVTIFLTTQYLEEADRLCHRLSIIDHGQIVVSGSPTELKKQIGGETISISLPDTSRDNLKKKSSRILKAISGVTKLIEGDHGFVVYAQNASHLVPEIVKVFNDNNIPIDSINLSSPSLDDVFLQYTGRRMRQEELSASTVRSKVAGVRGYS
jgi:daunorubicin resistance ABC transporter ATP-binding subunit